MTINLLKSDWDIDPAELRFILFARIGGPGQYHGRDSNPNTFYIPLAGSSCRIKLTFSDSKQIVAIDRGPAFDAPQWEQIVEEIERAGPPKVGRDCSFSSFRVAGSWRGKRSGVQILPPPADAPRAPCEMAEHPFILEYPVIVSDLWPITNFRRMREHRQLTLLLNVLLAGSTTIQPRRSRHLWAIVPEEGVAGQEVKWVQEFYFTNYGEAVRNELSPPAAETLEPGFPRWIDRNGMIRACFSCNGSVSGHFDRGIQWVTGENKHFVFNSTVSSSSNSTERTSRVTRACLRFVNWMKRSA